MRGGGYRPHLQEAALALSHGWDPIAYLDLVGVEHLAAKQVLQYAVDAQAERDKAHWKNMVNSVANGIARAFKGGK